MSMFGFKRAQGGTTTGWPRPQGPDGVAAGSFLNTAAAAGDGTIIAVYDMQYSTLLDAPSGSPASDAGTVGSVSDVSGNQGPLVQSTAGSRPTLDADGFGGEACLTFDGGDVMQLSGFAGGALSQIYTKVIAVQLTGFTDNQVMMDGDTINQGYLRAAQTSGAAVMYAGSFANGSALGTGLAIHICTFDGANTSWLDGETELMSSQDVGAGTTEGMTLGGPASGSGSKVLNGTKIAAAAIYDGDIGSTAKAYIWAQAQARWGLS